MGFRCRNKFLYFAHRTWVHCGYVAVGSTVAVPPNLAVDPKVADLCSPRLYYNPSSRERPALGIFIERQTLSQFSDTLSRCSYRCDRQMQCSTIYDNLDRNWAIKMSKLRLAHV